jgi:hypothetical protein
MFSNKFPQEDDFLKNAMSLGIIKSFVTSCDGNQVIIRFNTYKIIFIIPVHYPDEKIIAQNMNTYEKFYIKSDIISYIIDTHITDDINKLKIS